MRRLNVAYFHQHFSTRQGAAGTRSYEFARRLVERGHRVTVICGTYGVGHTGLSGEFTRRMRRGVVDGIDVVEFLLPYANADPFLRRSWTFLRYVTQGLRFALSRQYDVVFATSTPLTAAIPGIVAKLILRRHFIFEVRDLWPELPRAMGAIRNPFILRAMDLLETAAYTCADACIGLAPGIVDGIRRKAPAKQVAMIPNGADLDPVDAGSPLPAEVAQQLARLAGRLKCIFAGAHGLANGLDAVLDTAGELKRRRRDDVVFLFVGTGVMKPALEQRAAREGLDNCLFFEPMPKPQLAVLQSGMDVGLMILKNVPAFYYGTSPNKFFDYLAAGLPVLINYPGWLASMVEAHGSGVAVPPDSAAAFADALEYLQGAPEARLRMGQRAKDLAAAQFSRDTLAAQFIEFIETVTRDA